jgi:hypothetical protein
VEADLPEGVDKQEEDGDMRLMGNGTGWKVIGGRKRVISLKFKQVKQARQ